MTRAEIDAIDTQLLALLEKRKLLAKALMQQRLASGGEIKDLARQQEILDRLTKQSSVLSQEEIYRIWNAIFPQ